MVGLHARDLRRWALGRRGHALIGVVVARDEEAGFARLAAERPELLGQAG